jgi:hypothetical protein
MNYVTRITGMFPTLQAAALAAGLRQHGTVRNWLRRGEIPQRHHARLAAAVLELHGIQLTAADFSDLPAAPSADTEQRTAA